MSVWPRNQATPGVDVPDRRGRVGLDQGSVAISRAIGTLIVRDVEVTSDGWHVLRRTTFDYRRRDGAWETQQRETYDRGNGADDPARTTRPGARCLLTRQFRFPVVRQRSSGRHADRGGRRSARRRRSGDRDPPRDQRGARRRARRARARLRSLHESRLGDRARCTSTPRRTRPRTALSDGGGLADDGEDIEVLELGFEEALAMVADGRIVDGKTVILLQWLATRSFRLVDAGDHRRSRDSLRRRRRRDARVPQRRARAAVGRRRRWMADLRPTARGGGGPSDGRATTPRAVAHVRRASRNDRANCGPRVST